MSSVLLIGKETETILSIAQALADCDCNCDRVSGGAGAIRRLRQHSFDVVITDPDTTIEEGLALIEEMRHIGPGMKAILLTPSSTPEEIIAALRARVFVCLSAPFDGHEIASFANRAATDSDWHTEIEVLSAQPEWISLRANCHRLTAERVVSFLGELHSELPESVRDKLMPAFREILLAAVANGVVYIGSGYTNGGTTLYALNAGDGSLVWKYQAAGYIFSSPAVANGVVYVSVEDGNIYGLDAGTGAVLWKYNVGIGIDSSPSIANGMVYVGSNSQNVYAFHLPQ